MSRVPLGPSLVWDHVDPAETSMGQVEGIPASGRRSVGRLFPLWFGLMLRGPLSLLPHELGQGGLPGLIESLCQRAAIVDWGVAVRASREGQAAGCRNGRILGGGREVR